MNKFKYAIETLKIEKYGLIRLHRRLRQNEHECQTSFSQEIKQTEKHLEQINSAIKKLEEQQ